MPNNIKASLFMVGAMTAFTLMAIAGRELSARLDTFEIMMYRSFIGIIIVILVGNFYQTLNEIALDRFSLHCIRNISHFVGQNLWFYAVTLIPLSQLFAFEFSTPLWVVLFAPFFLQEKLTPKKFFNTVLGFIGIIIIARPDITIFNYAVLAAIFCAFGFAGAAICTKALTKNQSITCILFWLVVMQSVFGALCAGIDGNIAIPNQNEMFWVTVIGLCGLTAHFCITKALQVSSAMMVMPLDFLRLPLISIVGFILYNEIITWNIVFGALLILLANFFNLKTEAGMHR